jgi:flagellin
MPLSTNNNIMAINVGRSISKTAVRHERELESVASGLRIRRARNDAAGLSISEGLRSQLTRLSQNVRNTETATDMLRVAEGSLGTATTILQRMRVLAVRSSNADLTDGQRQILTSEYDEASSSLDRMAQATVYNDRILLAGTATVDKETSTAFVDKATTGVVTASLSGAEKGVYTFTDDGGRTLSLGNGVTTQTINTGVQLDAGRVAAGTKTIANFDRLGIELTLAGTGASRAQGAGAYEAGELDGKTLVIEAESGGSFQVGPTLNDADQIDFGLPDLRASGDLLNLDAVSLSSQPGARKALDQIDLAIEAVSNARGTMGALLNRLTHSISFSENEIENMTASESTIRDTDMARSAIELARNDILNNTSTVMLSQTFTNSRQALSLL